MQWLKAHTARVQELVDSGTDEALTFAALRCRTALELVCYERLRNVHDYISTADLADWRPTQVINQLIQDVEPSIAADFTVSISKRRVANATDPTLEDYEAEEFVEIGRQVGFDPTRLRSLWQALGNFLHAPMPRSREDALSTFGEPEKLRRKVLEVLTELRRLEQGTLIASGAGDPQTVRFTCNCNTENKRRAAFLREGQVVSCIKPDCREKWTVQLEDGAHWFERRSMSVTCHACAEESAFSEAELLGLPRNTMMKFTCQECGETNHLLWKLMHMKREDPDDGADAG